MRRTLFVLSLLACAAAAQGQLVTPRSSATTIVIPGAGSVAGANGTFFRSDVVLVNYRNADQRVALQWIPQNAPGGGVATVTVTLAAKSGLTSEDFVANVLHESGLGAVVITPVTSQGFTDDAAVLYATARIWTPQPGTTGNTSQSFPTLAFSDINSTTLTMHGHRRDDRYRTNVGIVNLSAFMQTFRVDVATSTGTETQTVDVERNSMRQVGLLGVNSTIPLQIKVTNTTQSSPSWIAYASTVDNVTGDAWSTLGFREPAP